MKKIAIELHGFDMHKRSLINQLDCGGIIQILMRTANFDMKMSNAER